MKIIRDLKGNASHHIALGVGKRVSGNNRSTDTAPVNFRRFHFRLAQQRPSRFEVDGGGGDGARFAAIEIYYHTIILVVQSYAALTRCSNTLATYAKSTAVDDAARQSPFLRRTGIPSFAPSSTSQTWYEQITRHTPQDPSQSQRRVVAHET